MKEIVPGRVIKQAALERHLTTMTDLNSSCRNLNLADDAIDMLLKDDPQLDYTIKRTDNFPVTRLDIDALEQ